MYPKTAPYRKLMHVLTRSTRQKSRLHTLRFVTTSDETLNKTDTMIALQLATKRYVPLRASLLALLCALNTSQAANFSDILSTEEARRENAELRGSDIAHVDPFSGNLTSSLREVFVPGNGGLNIEIHRRYDATMQRQELWAKSGQFVGMSALNLKEAEYAPFGTATQGWSLIAAPVVSIRMVKSGSSFYPAATMTDSSNKICSGLQFRQFLTPDATGGYGTYGDYISYIVTLPTGEREALVPMQTGVAQSRSGWKLTCSGGTGGVHTLRSPMGMKYTLGRKFVNNRADFPDGQVATKTPSATTAAAPGGRIRPSNVWTDEFQFLTTQQEDLRGNTLTYTYTDMNEKGFTRPQLSSISAGDGRQVSFVYEAVAGSTASNGYIRLQQISAGSGAAWQYGYDTRGLLATVSGPGGRVWRLEYFPFTNFEPATPLISGTATHTQPNWAKSNLLKKITIPSGGSISVDYAPSELWW